MSGFMQTSFFFGYMGMVSFRARVVVSDLSEIVVFDVR